MTQSIILLAAVIATSFSSVAQSESVAPERLTDLSVNVSSCCAPITLNRSMGCSGPVKIVEKTEEDLLDITDPELFLISASPNPTKGYLTVSVPPNLIGYQIQIIDMTGRFVGNPVQITGEKVGLNIEGDSGVYLLSIRTEKEIITERILLDK